ncbi:DUF4136 domain-containing protein [Aquiflexum sp. LQ15W]|uniref:DUF4136 domain-containing protein n=1 Tax=Cognataquiflexum nitidum TaxID=2922272 RepID=UPI001F12AAA5|nr:DUF4136 domain-containing protein [Cognataquiflexum nitidum]MCH6200856.1 DUF4136 domain-containing protein [Cognataquiflexum nitidum]
MKKSILILFSFSLFFSACVSQKDYIADYDFNYAGNFKKYKTFGFVNNPFPDTTTHYLTIERTITNRLGSQGFKLQPEKPDILINYKVFTEDVKYRGYEQPNFDFWVQRRSADFEVTEEEEKENREKDENYNQVKFMENNGMLVIFVIDNKRGNTIWQGYTAASFDFFSPEVSTELTKATYRVMDQFKILTRN